MAKNITAKDVAAAKLILAAYEAQGKAKKGKKAKKAVWTDRKGRTFQEAKKAHRKARKARFNSTPLGGLTSTQRREIAATLPYGYSAKQWTKAVATFKAGGFR